MDQKPFSPPVQTSPLLKMIFQNAKSASILILDQEGIILDVNHGIRKNFGYSRESLIGKNYSLLFVEGDKWKQLPEKELKKALETGSSDDKSFFQKKDLTPIWVHRESILTTDENGQSLIIKIIHDIHTTKLLEEELRKSYEKEQQIIKDRDTFIYITSHDLQSPISNIDGLINALKGSYPHPEEFDQVMEMLDLSVKRFRTKLAELYAFGKRQGETKAETTSFQEALNEVLFDMEDEIKSSQAEIISDFSKVPTSVLSKIYLKNILQNLVSNSVKFKSPCRGLKIMIWTENGEDGYMVLKIRDNGLGIKMEDKHKIFRMYFRGNPHITGTGMGMAIVKRIVEKATGKIELESTLGEGSTFKISLPEHE